MQDERPAGPEVLSAISMTSVRSPTRGIVLIATLADRVGILVDVAGENASRLERLANARGK